VTSPRHQGPAFGQVLAELTAWLTGELPGLAPSRAQVLVEQAAGQYARRLLEYVREWPEALSDPAPLLPVSAVRLAHALHRDGYTQVVLPRCASCGQPRAALKTPRPEGRICAWCRQREHPQDCIRCGWKRPVQARTSAGPVCGTCYAQSRPARQCEVCGQIRPLARRAGRAGPAVCGRCNRPERACVLCGRLRPGHYRRADGNTYCITCYPRSPRECARCGRCRLVNAEWPIGPVCGTCYTYVRKHPAACPACGQIAALSGADSQHRPICGPCAGWRGPTFACHGCGAPDLLEYGRCARCVLRAVTRDLLAGADPAMHGQLSQLAEALTAGNRPRAALRWLRASGGGQILASLAASQEPISHALLDQMPSSAALHILRDRLVIAGALPERLEYLDRIPAWTSRLVAAKPAGHARMIRGYAQWDALRRARRRAAIKPADGQARAVRTKIRAASAFLDWIEERGYQLETLTQHHLDSWLISHRLDTVRALSPFLSWARQRRLCGDLTVPARPRSQPGPGLAGDQRWQHLHTCLTSTSMPLTVRAAGAIALLYGAALSHILMLRTNDVTTINGRCHIQLSQHPLLLPPALARLIRQQAAVAAAWPPTPAGSRWLFPGQTGLRPYTSLAAVTHLNNHDIHVRAGRTAALIDLAGQLPAAVLASLLGLHPDTADKWSRRIASDWAAYLEARTQPDQ
jgi:hypothetical protein